MKGVKILIATNLIFALGLFAAWEYRTQPPGTAPLTLISGEEQPEKPYTLLVFFSADTSCACQDDWGNWVDLATKHKNRLNIKGIQNGDNQDAFIAFGTGLNLPFPLFKDAGNLRNSLGIRPGSTAKVLIGPEGNLLYADTDQSKPKDLRYFNARVKAIVEEST